MGIGFTRIGFEVGVGKKFNKLSGRVRNGDWERVCFVLTNFYRKKSHVIGSDSSFTSNALTLRTEPRLFKGI